MDETTFWPSYRPYLEWREWNNMVGGTPDWQTAWPREGSGRCVWTASAPAPLEAIGAGWLLGVVTGFVACLAHKHSRRLPAQKEPKDDDIKS